MATQGRLIGVGVGPGDPDLMTLRGLRAIERASIVLAPTLEATTAGRAERVVRELAPGVPLRRVVMPMTSVEDAARRRQDAAAGVAPEVAAQLRLGRDVVWVTLGDPGIYSTFWLVVEAVRHEVGDVAVEVVPGVVALGALAAAACVELLDGDERLLLVTGAAPRDQLAAALADPHQAVVVYKPGQTLAWIQGEARRLGRRGVVGWLLGTPQAQVCELDAAPAAVPYLTTAIVLPQREPAGKGVG